MDTLYGEIDRFNQEGIKLLGQIESLLINACNVEVNQPSDTLESLYRADINFQRLQVQLAMLPDLLKVVNDQDDPIGIKITRVMTISTICGLMNTSSFGKSMFSEVNTLLHVYLTVPMTSATAERSFSSLRRVKTYLQSTVSQERLNHILLHTHKVFIDELNVELAKEFIKVMIDQWRVQGGAQGARAPPCS